MNTKKQKKKAGRCPVCGKELYKTKQALMKKLKMTEDSFDTQSEQVTEEDIKKAFREVCKEVHPDKGGSPEEFQEVKEAKEELLEMLDGKESLDIDSVEEVSKPLPSLQQVREMRQTVNKIKSAWNSAKDPCPYCKQKSS